MTLDEAIKIADEAVTHLYNSSGALTHEQKRAFEQVLEAALTYNDLRES